MSSPELPDRPATLRRGPRPAPDEQIDPVDYRPAQPPAAPAVTAPLSVPANEPKAAVRPKKAPAAAPEATSTPAAALVAAQGRVGRPRRREVTMPFSTRLRVETVDLIDDIVARDGTTIRAIVEEAIQARWGKTDS